MSDTGTAGDRAGAASSKATPQSRRRWARRPTLSTEALALLGCAFMAVVFNARFWGAALDGRDPWSPASWRFAIGCSVLLTALGFAVVGSLCGRRTIRPLLSVLFIVCAVAAFFMQRYGVVIDPAMMRNALATDPREAGELMGMGLLGALAAALVPISAVWWIRLRAPVVGRTRLRALIVRIGWVLGALALAVAALLVVFQDLGSLMRNQRELRYTLVPGNVVYSLARALIGDARAAVATRAPSEPAVRVASPGRRPTLFILVVGETVRSANFGLDGYARDTTPELRKRDVLNFPRTLACGTSTEVSLPCMFSPFGRDAYDPVEARRHDSLLHVLANAGMRVVWLDNQSGCKGVCDGLETQDLSKATVAGLCSDGRCFDEILLHGLESTLGEPGATRDTVIVMHQLGNHGPAYHRRYPAAFKRFEPACEKAELRDCSREQIVNAYDNAVLYTDHFLSRVIDFLQGRQDRFDVAMAYVSDHGESLGERGLYLHGMPRAVAPREQLEVPMLWWMPPQAARGMGMDPDCLRQRGAARTEPASHDHLYHSVLGLLSIDTPTYKTDRDLFAGCRR